MTELKEAKTPDDPNRKSAVKIYQNGMDSRLSIPKRVESKFNGFNQRSTGNLSITSSAWTKPKSRAGSPQGGQTDYTDKSIKIKTATISKNL